MQIAVVNAAQRHCELIADLAAKGTRLPKLDVMRIRRTPAADQPRVTSPDALYRVCGPASGWRPRFRGMARSLAAVSSESSGPYFQSDADLSRIVFSEVNTGLLKSLLYFEDGREVSFHDALVLFDALQGRQANPRSAGELALTPA